jgi:diaminopimelate decarboxylase
MKGMGPIPRWFGTENAMLQIGGRSAADLIAEAGHTPLFVYDTGIVSATIQRLRAAMPKDLGIHYAMKANPFPPLLAEMAGKVDGFDVASLGELNRAMEAGVKASAISFAGPGKRDDELEAAIAHGVTINLESEGEARRALAIADRIGSVPRLAVRVNPDFDLRGSGMKMGGGAKPFGVDAERAAALAKEIIKAGADWRGWHIFAGSQTLDVNAIIEAESKTLSLAYRLSEEVGASPPVVNMGGGLGVPYFPGDLPIDPRPIGLALREALDMRPAILRDSHFAIELGRFLVAEAGVYLCRVVDVKQSHGETFVVVDGGLHHQLAASGNFGTVIRRNYPLAIANKMGADPSDRAVSVVGCLCTPLDRLGDQIALPEIEVGDIVAVFLAGAYGASASPSAFLGHGPAKELLVNEVTN